MASPQWHFAGFHLDLDNACLWRGAQAIALTPKAFDVLHYLVTHADRVVTKDALLDAVWPETAISDAVVRVAIGELRRGPGRYGANAPVHCHGAPPGLSLSRPCHPGGTRRDRPGLTPCRAASAQPASAFHPLRPAARRARGRVGPPARGLAQVRQGQRQVLFLTGEPGIGKTAVVDAFMAQVSDRSHGAGWRSGQCVEHYGPGEPYLPVLDALGQLCRGPAGQRLGTLLRQQAPTWLVQMPWLLTPADREQLQQELQGTTRERMLRECAEVLETLTAETPLVLVLEDLHWSDHATLDLLTLLARRRTPAQFLLLGTYRPVETIVHSHPLRTVVQDLQRQGHGMSLPLAPLAVEAVHRLPDGPLPRAPVASRTGAVATSAHRRQSAVSGHHGVRLDRARCAHRARRDTGPCRGPRRRGPRGARGRAAPAGAADRAPAAECSRSWRWRVWPGSLLRPRQWRRALRLPWPRSRRTARRWHGITCCSRSG